MPSQSALDRGREAFERQAWADAYAQLSEADAASSLPPDDLERLAMAAALTGRDAESADLLLRAHQALFHAGQTERAARAAAWLALSLLGRGEAARAGGWIARARRLHESAPLDSLERAYLLLPLALQRLFQGHFPDAYDTYTEAAAIGHRLGDPDLTTLADLGRGRALIALGRAEEGTTLLDEAMVAVTSGEVAAVVCGVVYCAVISACWDLFDLRRAQEWTDALDDWSARQPDLVPFRGECLVHRAELMLLHGQWPDALEEVHRACQLLAGRADASTAGDALYQEGELQRLRGAFSLAEDAYRRANQAGRRPQPGLALLRLAQGDLAAALAALRRELDEAETPVERGRLLPAHVEALLAAGEVAAARSAANELSQLAAQLDAPFLHAVAAHATGAVLLAEADSRSALTALRRAWATWQALGAPYEAARTRVLIAVACREHGDHDTAQLELDAARATFRQLDAAPDLARLESLIGAPPPVSPSEAAPAGLTARELEVLRLVAAGKTNRAIAADLVLSEKTVARHVSNIFTKLDLSTRAAATAYAYEHRLV